MKRLALQINSAATVPSYEAIFQKRGGQFFYASGLENLTQAMKIIISARYTTSKPEIRESVGSPGTI